MVVSERVATNAKRRATTVNTLSAASLCRGRVLAATLRCKTSSATSAPFLVEVPVAGLSPVVTVAVQRATWEIAHPASSPAAGRGETAAIPARCHATAVLAQTFLAGSGRCSPVRAV